VSADKGKSTEELLGALHDVSNALTVLLGWAEEARSPEVSAAALDYALCVIIDETKRARALARRTLGADADEVREPLDAAVTRIVRALERERERRGVRFELSLQATGVEEPAPSVGQIVQNLLLNALAFAPPGSTIHVRTEALMNRCVVSVRDEGPGVAPERVERIFQGESTRTGGSGVGLRHARALAASLGGDLVWVPPLGQERGAHFQLSWPGVPAAPVSFASVVPPPPVSKRASQVLAGLRVLVVEDDPAVIGLLEVALAARGAEVEIVSTIQGLLGASGAHDAVLLDLSPVQGRLDGALEVIRTTSPSARLLVTTGSVEVLPPSLRDARVVRKPFEVGEIVAALTDEE
jgi:CheY-like chemotaxis protein